MTQSPELDLDTDRKEEEEAGTVSRFVCLELAPQERQHLHRHNRHCHAGR